MITLNTSAQEVQRKLLIQILTNKLDDRQYNLTEELFKILQLKNISLSTTSTTSSTGISSNSSNFPPNGSNNNATGLVRNKEAVILIFIFVLWIYSIGRMFFVWRDILNFSAEQQPILSWSSLMEYLRSLKKPALEAGSEEGTRREVESAHTEEFNSVEEQEVVTVRGIQKSVDKASEQDTCALTSIGFTCKALKSSSDEVVHI